MEEKKDIKNLVIIGIVCVSVLIISLIAYLINSANSDGKIVSDEDLAQISDSESTSTQMGKTIEESKTEENDDEYDYETANVMSNKTNTTTSTSANTTKNTTTTNTSTDTKTNTTATATTENTTIDSQETSTSTENEDTEITFIAPVEGEILREFATDSLVYSETLKEWITHNGIDIKADKTTVVTASADGTVSAIKNDPRYGLTVIINHNNGYQTVYSNLLTSEFVVKGEEITQGQSIGTVGNSASFEVNDEYHLHFELLKDNEYLDPTLYIENYD